MSIESKRMARMAGIGNNTNIQPNIIIESKNRGTLDYQDQLAYDQIVNIINDSFKNMPDTLLDNMLKSKKQSNTRPLDFKDYDSLEFKLKSDVMDEIYKGINDLRVKVVKKMDGTVAKYTKGGKK